MFSVQANLLRVLWFDAALSCEVPGIGVTLRVLERVTL